AAITPHMHAVAHSFAQRAPPATRTKARWQPYTTALQMSASLVRSPNYLITPAPSVSSSPVSTRVCEIDRLTPSTSHSSSHPQIRDVQKTRYAIGLVGKHPGRLYSSKFLSLH